MVKKHSESTNRTNFKNIGLFSHSETEAQQNTTTLPTEQIILPPTQPRRYFDSDAQTALNASVKEVGILHPLLVRPLENKDQYELVAGARRFHAAQENGFTVVPVIIKTLTDAQAQEIALTENLQRQDLNPLEETEGILSLLALRLNISPKAVVALLHQIANTQRNLSTDNVIRKNQQQIIDDVFKTVSQLTPESFRVNRLPLLNLPPEIKSALQEGKIAYTKARALSKIPDELAKERQELLNQALAAQMSLSQIKKEVTRLTSPKDKSPLKSRFESTIKRVKQMPDIWSDPNKQKQLEDLLTQLEKLIELPS